MGIKKSDDYRIGKFLTENGIITGAQLQEALELQKDNRDRLLGEILVTMGVISKEELVMSIEMYMMMTDTDDMGIDEWLDQEEVDLMLKNLESSKSKSS